MVQRPKIEQPTFRSSGQTSGRDFRPDLRSVQPSIGLSIGLTICIDVSVSERIQIYLLQVRIKTGFHHFSEIGLTFFDK